MPAGAEHSPGAGRGWSSRSLGGRWQHAFFYRLLKTVGLKPAKFCLFFVTLFYALRPAVYRRALPYLARRFGAAGLFRRFSQVFRLYWNFAVILLERAAIGILGGGSVSVSPEDEERFPVLLNQAPGLLVLSAHVGFWQFGPAGLRDVPVRINLVQRRDMGDVDRHFFEHGHAGAGANIKLLDPGAAYGGMVEMSAALLRGEILCMMGDRVTPEDKFTVAVDFLGGRILLPGAPYLLASITSRPILLVFTLRTGVRQAASRHHGVLNVPAKLPRTADAVRPYAQEFARQLEGLVLESPYQFFNFHNLWVTEQDDV